MPTKAVVLGADNDLFRRRVGELNTLAQKLGRPVEFLLVNAKQPFDEMVAACADAVAIVPGTAGALLQLSAEETTALCKRVPSVKLVQSPSSGTDHMDCATLGELGVAVANHGGANAPAVAEHTIVLTVAVLRKLSLQLTSVLAGTWSRPLTTFPEAEFRTLVGKTVGLVGLGRIGSGVARRLQGWGCEVVYCDVLDFAPAYERELHVKRVDFDTLLAISDVVSLHVPLEDDTHHLMSDAQFVRMKPTSILINTCRGPVVDETALINALQNHTIFGAGLDVLEIEPMPKDYALAQLPNVMITPHAGTRAVESTDNAKRFVIENIDRIARGEPPQSVVNAVAATAKPKINAA